MTTLAGQYDPAIERVIGDDQVAPATTVDVLMAACSLPQRALTQPYASPAMIHEANSTTMDRATCSPSERPARRR